jgi:cytosine/creatinine deaminase
MGRTNGSVGSDEFLAAAIAEGHAGHDEGGIPIGSVLVVDGEIAARGPNRRVQAGSAILHAEMGALDRAGRLPHRPIAVAPCIRRCRPATCTSSRSSSTGSPGS